MNKEENKVSRFVISTPKVLVIKKLTNRRYTVPLSDCLLQQLTILQKLVVVTKLIPIIDPSGFIS